MRLLTRAALYIVVASATTAPLDGYGRGAVADWNSVDTPLLPGATFFNDGSGTSLPINETRFPNPRTISNRLLSSPPFRLNDHGITAVTLSLCQWVANDLMHAVPLYGSAGGETVPVPVPACDVDMDGSCSGSRSLTVRRLPYASGTGTSAANPRRAVSATTGWLDASSLYGASAARHALVRAFYGGLLSEDPVNGVPRNTGCAPMGGPLGNACAQRLTADARGNMVPGLLALHGVFLKEHNRIARALGDANPGWNDEALFQAARRRVAATLQHITVNELLPVLLGGANGAAATALPPYAGFNASVDPRISPAFAFAAFRFGHSGATSLQGCVKGDGSACPTGTMLLRDVYYSPSYLDYGVTIGDIIRGDAATLMGAVDTALVAGE